VKRGGDNGRRLRKEPNGGISLPTEEQRNEDWSRLGKAGKGKGIREFTEKGRCVAERGRYGTKRQESPVYMGWLGREGEEKSWSRDGMRTIPRCIGGK